MGFVQTPKNAVQSYDNTYDNTTYRFFLFMNESEYVCDCFAISVYQVTLT